VWPQWSGWCTSPTKCARNIKLSVGSTDSGSGKVIWCMVAIARVVMFNLYMIGAYMDLMSLSAPRCSCWWLQPRTCPSLLSCCGSPLLISSKQSVSIRPRLANTM
jgi:hypothetical protein